MEDYTFLHMGELYQGTMDVMVAACKRFGAEKAESVISEIGWGIREEHSDERIIDNVEFETKAKIKPDDIQFMRKMLAAEDAIKYAITTLREAKLLPTGKDKKNGK